MSDGRRATLPSIGQPAPVVQWRPPLPHWPRVRLPPQLAEKGGTRGHTHGSLFLRVSKLRTALNMQFRNTRRTKTYQSMNRHCLFFRKKNDFDKKLGLVHLNSTQII